MKHGWNSWDNYWHIHEKVLRVYSKYMLAAKTYRVVRHTEFYYELLCTNALFNSYNQNVVRIDIRKDVEIDSSVKAKLQARTIGYTYSANRPNPDGKNLIRYCSPHDDHNQYHHKHDFTVNPAQVHKIADDAWPHVGEFLHEVLLTF